MALMSTFQKEHAATTKKLMLEIANLKNKVQQLQQNLKKQSSSPNPKNIHLSNCLLRIIHLPIPTKSNFGKVSLTFIANIAIEVMAVGLSLTLRTVILPTT